MTPSPNLIERDKNMRLPDLPLGKCVNHPTRQSVSKRLCSECFVKWETSVLSFEAIQEGNYDE